MKRFKILVFVICLVTAFWSSSCQETLPLIPQPERLAESITIYYYV